MSTRVPAVPGAVRPLGRTGLMVTSVAIGGGPLGGMPAAFGYDTPSERAAQTVLRAFGGPLGMDRVPLLYLHDPEHLSFAEGVAPGGPVEELVKIRDEGLAQHLGVAGGPVDLMARYLRTEVFEVLITHNRWTLVDRSANDLIDEAGARGVGVVNGAPFGGGILARGTAATDRYAYRPAASVVLDRVRRMERLCQDAGVPLAAAALQFSLRDPRIASTIVGITRPERIDETARYVDWPIDDGLWKELDPLAAPRET